MIAPAKGPHLRASDAPPAPTAVRAGARLLLYLTCFAIFLAILLFGQFVSNAYRAELSGYPDEPAHYVTGLMFQQYIAEHVGAPLESYAQEFYVRYPKVAIGHWPPVLYTVQTVWTLLFSPSRTSCLLFQAFVGSMLGLLVFHELRERSSAAAAFTASSLLLASSLIQTYSTMIMAETLLALIVFAAASGLADLMERPTLRNGIRFGVLASAAILTKGSGWLLLLTVAMVPLLARKQQWLRSKAMILALCIIGIVTVPWQVFTMRYVVNGWQHQQFSLPYSIDSVVPTAQHLATHIGLALSVLAVIGIARYVRDGDWRLPSFPASMLAVVLATFVFNILVPTGIEGRKLISAMPAAAALAVLGCQHLIESIRRFRPGIFAPVVVCTATACVFAVTDWRMNAPKQSYGFREAAQWVSAELPPDRAILVSSESDGEGMFIAELAMLNPSPKHYAVRASKYVASTDWTGERYNSRVGTIDELRAALEAVPISYVLIDRRKSQPRRHHRLLTDMLRDLKPRHSSPDGNVQVFQLRDAAPVARLELDLRPMLDRSLTVR